MTDAETLRRAATKVREIAEDPGQALAEIDTAIAEGGQSLVFVVGTRVGRLLADWMEREAKVVGRRHPGDYNPAVELARVIVETS